MLMPETYGRGGGGGGGEQSGASGRLKLPPALQPGPDSLPLGLCRKGENLCQDPPAWQGCVSQGRGES